LSSRYIADRQLPDKAIDLIDEAASCIRMELDSKPEVMDKLERRLIQLKIEHEATKKDSDKASQKRLATLNDKIQELGKEFIDLEEAWKAEKAAIQGSANIKEKLEQARTELKTAQRSNDLILMSELRYSKIPELEYQLDLASQAEMQEMTLLRNNVTKEEIAEVVSKWTSIPVAKIFEGERDKLLRNEHKLI
jgi:ATP-dependent Clp protease ATP-binding subunit ClpB